MKVTDKMYEAGMTYLIGKGTAWSCKDLFDVMYKASEITYISYPPHAIFNTGCCGIFMDLQPEGLFCPECNMEITEAIEQLQSKSEQFKSEVKDMLRAMWGGVKQGAHIDFRKCETDAINYPAASGRGILPETK